MFKTNFSNFENMDNCNSVKYDAIRNQIDMNKKGVTKVVQQWIEIKFVRVVFLLQNCWDNEKGRGGGREPIR